MKAAQIPDENKVEVAKIQLKVRTEHDGQRKKRD